MAKKSVIARQKKREATVKRYAEKRAKLKATIVDQTASAEDRWAAMVALQKMPRNASKVRLVNRCSLTGRPRGVFRKFMLSRNMLRIVAMRGEVPGIVKSSW